MQQLTFEDIYDEFVKEIIHLKESAKNELLIQMASAIMEVLESERRKTNDNLSGQ